MRKSTATISLVLLGTAMAMAGCHSKVRDEEKDKQQQPGARGGVYTGARYIPVPVGTGGGSGTSTAAPSARGGFGGTAAAGAHAGT